MSCGSGEQNEKQSRRGVTESGAAQSVTHSTGYIHYPT